MPRSDEPQHEEELFQWLSFSAGIILVSAIKFSGKSKKDKEVEVEQGIAAGAIAPSSCLMPNSSILSFISAYFYYLIRTSRHSTLSTGKRFLFFYSNLF